MTKRTLLKKSPCGSRIGTTTALSFLGTLLGTTLSLTSCSGSSGGGASIPATVPDFAAAVFSDPTRIDHPFFELVPGSTPMLRVESPDGVEVIVIEVLDLTRVVAGVSARVVRDRAFEDELLIEDTFDWYAQDDAGNVWYLGEDSTSFEYDDDGNLVGTSTAGSWEAGLDVAGTGRLASPGFVMKAAPMPGDVYHQEYYRGEAEDQGTVIALNVPIQLDDGRMFSCLQIRDSSRLQPGADEDKFYAAGVGLVLEREVGGPAQAELLGVFETGPGSVPDFGAALFGAPTTIDNPFVAFVEGAAVTFLAQSEDDGLLSTETIVVERLDTTRLIQGVTCAVVRDRVFQDGLLVEDTFDWYAQDDQGNVWYMGEDSTSYEYDEDDNLIGTSSAGSWEAGQDVAGVGTLAEPGYLMEAAPAAGDSYSQEFYADEAEDMAVVVRLDASVELEDGTTHDGCLQTLEWNPLEPGALEYKFYAPGVGVVVERVLHRPQDEEVVELRGVFRTGPEAIPDFGAAGFSASTLIDNPFFPLSPGTTLTYESDTADGLETIVTDVLAMTRVVLGVTCVVVHDQAFLDGVLIEDTFDWYAQDDAGNVWYMGEDTMSFEFDDDGNPIGTSTAGSWEAGLDVAGVGSLAEPGFLMRVTPAGGSPSYHQEFYPDEAEDMALEIATGLEVDLSNGDSYAGCLQVLEWNPLEPGNLEYKFYAPGVGVVLEVGLGDGQRVELESVL